MPASDVNPSDSELIDRAIRGERDARELLFLRYRDAAFRVAVRITGREPDALDIVQDVFIKAFESLESFQRDAGFKTWLLRIVSNRSLDLLRSRKVRNAVSIERSGSEGDDETHMEIAIDSVAGRASTDVSADAERSELGDQLRAAIDSLPADQRTAFMLYADGELTYAEISEIIGIPIGTVMSRIFYARQRLEKMLADLAPHRGRRS